ncbi:MAG: hypothetical protein DYH07_11205 [Armatimonadetes bacterium ATM1]|nr:MAG: hypothetical protein EDM73_11365 [Armatimonadota bacterium]MBC6970241.1 hypothetical protein [Armatimonadota bacterium]MCE7900643.1 hypothetical protein [Armatimonadetes bacterium ATM1]RIJ97184.1 MAG: hypothetical protein DCC45_03870 [Armatimonadota bacterium]
MLGRPNTWKLRIGGQQAIRVEAGNVHLVPGFRRSAIGNVLHFHILDAELHLPYQTWPILATMYLDLLRTEDYFKMKRGAVPLE